MGRLWLVFLAVNILYVYDVVCSVSHGVIGGSGFTQLIPYHVAFSYDHIPIAYPELHGLRVEEHLAADGKSTDHPPAPVVEVSVDDVGNNDVITKHELIQHIFKSGSTPGSGIDIVNAANSTVDLEEESVESPAVKTLPSSITPEIPYPWLKQLGLGESELLPPLALPKDSSSGTTNADGTILEEITENDEVHINIDKGKLQMQGTLVSGGKEVRVSVGHQHQPIVETIPVVASELPALGIPGGSKPKAVANVNVNVNVNVNGDGTGSIINSTSAAEITAPIKRDQNKFH